MDPSVSFDAKFKAASGMLLWYSKVESIRSLFVTVVFNGHRPDLLGFFGLRLSSFTNFTHSPVASAPRNSGCHRSEFRKNNESSSIPLDLETGIAKSGSS